MRGNTEPIPTHYNNGLQQLLNSMLHLDPNKRPTTNELMAHPILINPVHNLYTDIGKIHMSKYAYFNIIQSAMPQRYYN